MAKTATSGNLLTPLFCGAYTNGVTLLGEGTRSHEPSRWKPTGETPPNSASEPTGHHSGTLFPTLMRVALLAFFAVFFMASPIGQSYASFEPSVAPRNGALVGPMLDEASWYGSWHHGRPTANGEAFDMFELTAAHRRLPFGTLVRVTDFDTGRVVIVRINDRGPYWAGRSLDLSYAAAEELGILDQGLARVRLEVVGRVTESAEQRPANTAAANQIG